MAKWQRDAGQNGRWWTEKTVATTRSQHHGRQPTGPLLEHSRGTLLDWRMNMSLAQVARGFGHGSHMVHPEMDNLVLEEDGEHVWRGRLT